MDAEWQIIYEKLEKCVSSGAKIILSKVRPSVPVRPACVCVCIHRPVHSITHTPTHPPAQVIDRATGPSRQSITHHRPQSPLPPPPQHITTPLPPPPQSPLSLPPSPHHNHPPHPPPPQPPLPPPPQSPPPFPPPFQLPIGDLATQYFADRQLFCAGRVAADDMARVGKATGAYVCVRGWNPIYE